MTAPAQESPIYELKERSLWRDALRNFFKNRLAIVGLVIVTIFLIFAVFADLIAPAPYDYAVLSETLKFPSAQHWLGTDQIGRDLLSRIIYGARISLTVGFSVQIIAFLIGVPLGALAGLRGGWIDGLVTRLIEIMTAFPSFLFAIFLMSILGSGLENVILAISVTSWIEVCRLTRAQFISLREREFITAAISYGTKDWRMIVRHILPNALPPLVIMFALGVPSAIFAEAGLSFLGVGINDPIPSWGKMVGESMGYLNVFWHLGVFPTVTIALAMLSFNFLGDGIRDALDPTMYNK
ncbi:MAG: ABC transporter permease [Anaerolineaceae bacterium]|nr:ABC transporter permease [Anaerolineaceae bacterium]